MAKNTTLDSSTPDAPSHKVFNERLQRFRDSLGFTRAAFAAKLGVTSTTLHRWETGSTRPSPTAAEKLQQLGFGLVMEWETNVNSIPRLNAGKGDAKTGARVKALRAAAGTTLITHDGDVRVLEAPFVRNGPRDQADFHHRLFELQASSRKLSRRDLSRRLSMVEQVEGFGPTAQHLLETPRQSAVSWGSSYGPHGWHRYVGRFPPHVVRALLNHFGADGTTVVCDPFTGSGTTAVECRLLGIPFVGIEICPLSCMMTRTKAAFPATPGVLDDAAHAFALFYDDRWKTFLGRTDTSSLTHKRVLAREGNPIPPFANIERWFTPAALLGTSIAVEFGMSLDGFSRDATLLALSSKMRSIGNVDVDVVRAEYRKEVRDGVDVGRLVGRQLRKMAIDIRASLDSHEGLIGRPGEIVLHEGSVLDVDLPEKSIDHVITSPPYGVEAISYLRTHLLSYRSLVAYLRHDPYETRDQTIGSEYIPRAIADVEHNAIRVSSTCRQFFASRNGLGETKLATRRAAMIQFCEDMLAVGQRLSKWLKDDGQVAFIIGNKRLGEAVIPMDTIITELFAYCDLVLADQIRHKLKTNNSNSQVPWQDRIIQEDSILLFRRLRRHQ